MEQIRRTARGYGGGRWIFFLWVALILVAGPIVTVQVQGFEDYIPDDDLPADIYEPPAGMAQSDCTKGKEQTMNDQKWLFINYRGLWEYRRSFHPYEGSQYLGKGDDARKDGPDNHDSVVFLNWQDTHMHLECPCATGDKVDIWKMYGKGSAKFHEDGLGDKKSSGSV